MVEALWASPWLVTAAIAVGLVALGLAALVLGTSVYKHILCLKYLFAGWKAVVPMVSALPAALGVFLLILVFAIMNGFAHDTREMTRGTLSDIIIDAHAEGLPYYDDFIREITAIPEVEAATPVIQTLGVLKVKPYRQDYPRVGTVVKPVVQGCRIIGIRPAQKVEMGRFQQYLLHPAFDAELAAAVGEVREHFRLQPPGADEATRPVPAIVRLARDLERGRREGLLAPEDGPGAELVESCLYFWRENKPAPAEFMTALSRWADQFQQRPRQPAVAPARLLDVPGEKRGSEPKRFGCIAGIGLIGTPQPVLVPETLQAGAAWRVLAVVLAIAAAAACLLLWQASRRHPGRWGWRAATLVCLVSVAALTAAAVLMPMTPRLVDRSQVIDFSLIDYGDELVLSTIPINPSGAIGTEAGGVPKVSTRALALVDIFKSGYWEADSTHLYVDFQVAQQMAGMDGRPAADGEPAVPARASQVQVKIRNPAQSKAVKAEVEKAWNRFSEAHPDMGLLTVVVNTWEEQQKMILTVVEVEKYITALMLGLMFLGFGVLVAMISYIMVYIRSRDIGILKALGARDAGVGSLFLGYGFIIGLIGTAIGMTGALLMLRYLDDIEAWVNQVLHINVFPREMYYFEHIPRYLSPEWCAAVGLAVLALSTLASLAGGLLAAFKQPVETLRYE